MRRAWCGRSVHESRRGSDGAFAALWLCAGAAVCQKRLVLEPYPPGPPANAPWRIVTDKDLGGRF